MRRREDRNREHRDPRVDQARERFKWEVARDLHLDDDIQRRGWGNMTARETGRIGGNMVRGMVGRDELRMDRDEDRCFEYDDIDTLTGVVADDEAQRTYRRRGRYAPDRDNDRPVRWSPTPASPERYPRGDK